MTRRTKDQIRKLVINYIINNKEATVSEIQDKLKVNVHRTFGGIENAFKQANVQYPVRKSHDYETAKSLVVEALKNNPKISIEDIQRKLKISFYKHFRNSQEAYRKANISFISKSMKRRLKKQESIAEYIKAHPNATQWEINKKCKTHVQEIFDRGIREAFERAKVNYPIERLNVYGTTKKDVRSRALDFENRILDNLRSSGAKTHVKTACGVADATIWINGNLYVIEVKDYRSKPISLTEIKQIGKYLNDLKCKNGIIICSGNRKIERIKFRTKDILIVPEKYTSRLDGVIKDMTWD